MKTLRKLCFASAVMVTFGLQAQDALTMQDINFSTVNYNTAFTAEVPEKFGASLTNTSGGGIQNTGQINFLAYTQLSDAKLALGTRINSKYFGLYRTSDVQLTAAKRIQLNSQSAIMAGINVGMQFTAIRNGQLNQYVDQMDPALANDEFPQYRFIVGLGLGYVWKETLRLGLSLPSFGKTESDFNPVYVFNGSYALSASEEIDLLPEVLLFGAGAAPIQAEFNAKGTYKEMFWLKAGWRTQNVFVGGMGVHVSAVSIGYVYNAFFQEYSTVVPAAHNINLTFRLSEGNGDSKRKYQLY